MLDFAAIPPEINSGLMYAGPGSGPMMAAAAAWDELASELSTAAAGYSSTVSELTSAPWIGAASSSMLSAVLPYIAWLSTMSGRAEMTAGQAKAAAAAFETAFMMTVPPPVIAANRVLLMNLIATNFFGQNTPAIAVTEAQYAEMWAQDAATMYTYSGSSALASIFTEIQSPPNTTTPDAESDQVQAVSKAAEQPAGNATQNLSQMVSQQTFSSASPEVNAPVVNAPAAPAPTGPFSWIINTIQDFLTYGLPTPANNWAGLSTNMYTTVFKQTLQAYFGVGLGSFGYSIQQQLTFGIGTTAGGSGAWYATPQFAGLFLGASHGAGAAAGAAHLATSVKVGGLSVPSTWGAGPAEALEERAISATTVHYLASETPASNGVLQGMPMAGGARRGAAGFTHKYGFKHSVLTRPPSAG